MMFRGDKLPVGFRLTGFRLGRRLLAILVLAMFGLILALPSAALAGVNQWTSSGPEGGDIYSLAFSPNYSADGTLFAGSYGIVHKSTNGGASWTVSIIGLADSYIRLVISPNYATDNTIFAGTGGGGSIRSQPYKRQ